MPAKEDVGLFQGATGGFAGGEANLWKFREGACDPCPVMCPVYVLGFPSCTHRSDAPAPAPVFFNSKGVSRSSIHVPGIHAPSPPPPAR